MEFRSAHVAVLSTIVFFSGACERQDEKERLAAARGQMQSMGPEGAGKVLDKMAPFATESNLAKTIARPELTSQVAGGDPQMLRWSFAEPKTFRYGYEQKLNNKMRLNSEAMEQQLALGAIVEVVSEGNGQGKLVFKEASGTRESRVASGKAEKSTLSNLPDVVIDGVSEDSAVSGQAPAGMGALLPFLFPLPQEAMSVGSKSKVKLKMPFNADKIQVLVEGSAEVTLVDFVEAGGHRCALLRAVYTIHQPDVDVDSKTEFGFSARGSGWLVFDTQDRCFHSGEMALIMSVRAHAEIPEEERTCPKVPAQMQMQLDADTWIRYRRVADGG